MADGEVIVEAAILLAERCVAIEIGQRGELQCAAQPGQALVTIGAFVDGVFLPPEPARTALRCCRPALRTSSGRPPSVDVVDHARFPAVAQRRLVLHERRQRRPAAPGIQRYSTPPLASRASVGRSGAISPLSSSFSCGCSAARKLHRHAGWPVPKLLSLWDEIAVFDVGAEEQPDCRWRRVRLRRRRKMPALSVWPDCRRSASGSLLKSARNRGFTGSEIDVVVVAERGSR